MENMDPNMATAEATPESTVMPEKRALPTREGSQEILIAVVLLGAAFMMAVVAITVESVSNMQAAVMSGMM